MNILIISNAFPLPGTPMRMWSIQQVCALQAAGCTVRAIQVLPSVPKWLGWLVPRMRHFCAKPADQDWDGVRVEYLTVSLRAWRYGSTRWRSNPGLTARLIWKQVRKKMRNDIDKSDYDLIYSIGLTRSGYVAVKLGEQLKVPVVVSSHSIQEIENCQTYPRVNRFVGGVLSKAKALIVPSDSMKELADSIGFEAPVMSLANPVMPPHETQKNTERPDFIAGRRVVFACGTLVPRKGFELLIEAFSLVVQQVPEAVLRIAGSGPLDAQLRKQIAGLGLQDNVEMIGRIDHQQVMQELIWADLFAMVSWREPFGMVYIEAAACRTPSLFCQDAGVAEVLREGVSGFSVPPRDTLACAVKLTALLKDDVDNLRRVGGEAYCVWEDFFSPSAFADKFKNRFDFRSS